MGTHFEQSLKQDMDRIGAGIKGMAAVGERALRDALRALQEGNRQLAYTVILRDRRIDEMERENDQLCLQFLVRQQPVAGPLRMAYATIRVNLELERIGDYAESIARQALKLIAMNVAAPINRFVEIADLSIPMLHNAVRAFVDQDAELARSTMKIEEEVDVLRSHINAELVRLRQENKIPLEALTPLMTIARRFERVSDQAKNICQEALYVCTGEYSKHKGDDRFRLLFVDEDNACCSVIAEAIGNSLKNPEFIFSGAGATAKPVETRTVVFLKEKGMDVSSHVPKTFSEPPGIGHYEIVVALGKEAQKALPPAPGKTVYLDWDIQDPSHFGGAPEQVKAAYERTYRALESQITDLIEAILGDKV